MRGKGGFGFPVGLSLGITPACAGKSFSAENSSRCTWDHPRVCGEKTTTRSIHSRGTGSPPRVRGKVRVQAPVQEHRGITPDCAGKSGRESGTRACCRDHPRMCGEKMAWIRQMPKCSGSPPRMRGKERFPPQHSCIYGITPAYAGKSLLTGIHPHTVQDHPRVCGEKFARMAGGWGAGGSPPRVRGKVRLERLRGGGSGITPACAGKRKRPKRWVRPPKDHPRVCGEKHSIQ